MFKKFVGASEDILWTLVTIAAFLMLLFFVLSVLMKYGPQFTRSGAAFVASHANGTAYQAGVQPATPMAGSFLG